MLKPLLVAFAAAPALLACSLDVPPGGTSEAAQPRSAQAVMRDAGGRQVATATIGQLGDGLRVRIEGTALAAGTYGAHVHAVGRCDSPDFASAGPHWNPTGAEHGKNNPKGMHKGDLPNLLVGADGRGSLEMTVPGASLTSGNPAVLDADGASIVIHERPDDYRTDPSGNSGGRRACGVFG